MAIKLNCQSGEIAYVYRVTDDDFKWLLNPQKFVTVVNLGFTARGLPLWSLEEPIPSPTPCPACGRRHQIDELPDAWLRPIRAGKGDDETLTWAGKPEKITQPEGELV